MSVARQPNLNKVLKYRARLSGEYEVGMDGVYLHKSIGGPDVIMAGETVHIALDCHIELLKDSMAFVQINPKFYKLGTATGPLILSDKHNTIHMRIEADEDIVLEDLGYIDKIIFEGL